MSARSSRNAGINTESTASLTAEVTTESKVFCCSLNASLIPLAIASSISSLEMVKSLNFFFIGDCPISLFRSPLTVEVLMMGPMQSGSKFTDRITKYQQSESLCVHRSRRVTWSPDFGRLWDRLQYKIIRSPTPTLEELCYFDLSEVDLLGFARMNVPSHKKINNNNATVYNFDWFWMWLPCSSCALVRFC